MRLILASQSPQRAAILSQLGVEFEVAASNSVEITEGDPEVVVVDNALRKARTVAERCSRPNPVLGADTEVAIDGRVLGKPRDEEHARTYLQMLSGRAHQVWGGVAVIDGSGSERSGAAMTEVVFRALTDVEIDYYLSLGEWRERAGGYAIQARGAMLIERITGDYLNVVGLAVSRLQEIAPEVLMQSVTHSVE